MEKERISSKQKLILFIRILKRIYRITKSFLASIYFGFPTKGLKIIGITGTSGKSTTTEMIYHVLKECNLKVGMISTVSAKADNLEIDTGFHVTTPDPIDFQKIVKKMRKTSSIKYLVCECSSHSLEQGRLGFTKFDISVFTNIQRDHLDYHFTWNIYATDKARLILKTKKNGTVIINMDDVSYNFLHKYVLKNRKNLKLLEYSKNEIQNFLSVSKLSFSFEDINFDVPILGDYNIYNVLVAIKVCLSLGISIKDISKALKTFPGVEGRMQIMKKEPFLVIVNFSHNTDSLEKSLTFAKSLVKEGGKLISVFGSAGLRDIEKRYKMGEVSGKIADVTIVTAEDPRTESLFDINTEIIKGSESSGSTLIKRFADSKLLERTDLFSLKNIARSKKSTFAFDEESVSSRFDAIKFAISIAERGDVIIIEGKGHEKTLCFGKTEYIYSDQESVRIALSSLE